MRLTNNMKLPNVKKNNIYRIFTVAAVIVTVVVLLSVVFNGRQYLTRRGVRHMATQIHQYGIWAPFMLGGLILINTLIPPIPIPIPLIEIAAGTVFGFWPGFLLVWVSQIISSLAAYYLSRYIAKLFLKKITESGFFKFYEQLIKRRGAFAVFVIRATMTAPFNISFVAGLSDMPVLKFTVGTVFGVISESAVFTYLGMLIVERVRFRLSYVLIILTVLSIVPTTVLFIGKLISKKGKK